MLFIRLKRKKKKQMMYKGNTETTIITKTTNSP